MKYQKAILQRTCPFREILRSLMIKALGGFPLSRNLYVSTSVKFGFANKIEAMYERSHLKVKVEPCSTARLSPTHYGEIKHRVYAKGKRESLPSDQVFHLLIVYCYSNYTKIDRFTPILSITIALSCFYQLISHFQNLST